MIEKRHVNEKNKYHIIKIILRIVLIICVLIIVFDWLRTFFVNKENIVGGEGYSYQPVYFGALFEIKNIFNAITPKIAIIIYSIIQLIFLVIAIKGKSFKQWLRLNIIVFLAVGIVNFVFSNFIIDQSSQMKYLTDTMFVYNSYEFANIANLVIDIVIFILGVLFSIRTFIKSKKIGIKKSPSDIPDIAMYSLAVLLALFIIFSNVGGRMYVIEEDWGFGEVYSSRQYSKKISDIKDNYNFTILDTDDEGILIEYTRGYYEPKEQSNSADSIKLAFSIGIRDYEYKTALVRQKLIWNIWYEFSPAHDPMLEVDGGTNYYIKFKN